MAYKYTGGKTVTVTVNNLASDTIACAYWYTGAVSPTGASYTIKGLLDDGNNSTSTDFAYNTVLKATASSPSSTSVTFKTVDNIYDDTNKRYPKYVLAYVKLLPHFHNGNTFGAAIQTSNIEIRQRQNSISCSTSSITDYWNRGNVTQYTVSTSAVNYSPSNAYVSTMNVSSNNSAVASVSSPISNGTQLPITLKSKGTATITISPGDGAGGTAKTISVTSKTGVTSISASYTGDLNTGASTSITVSKTPSNADATTFTIAKTSGSASIPSSSSFGGSFSVSGTSGSPVLKFTSGDGLVAKSIKITNHTAVLSCSGSTPIKNQTFTYSISGQYGTGTYTFSGCQHSSAGTAKVTADSGTATVKWTPADGGGTQSASIALGNSTTAISATGYTANLNAGADTTVTVAATPSNPKVGTFNASVVSGTASISTSNTNYGSFSIKDVNSSPVIKFTSGDGFVNKSIKITTHAATLSCSGTTPIKNQTFTYTISGQYGTGTYTFSGCQHSSSGTAKVTANSGTATVTWTPSDGGWSRSASIGLGNSTTGISATGYTGNLNSGADTTVTVAASPSNPKVGTFNASVVSGSATISTSNTNYGSFSIKDVANAPVIKFTSGDGFVNSSIKITTHTATLSCSGTTPIKNQTFSYNISGQYGTGTYTFSGCQHSSAGVAKVTANSGSATVTWTPSDGGWAQSTSIALGNSTTAISATGYTGNLNVGADTTVTVAATPSNPKVGTFNASLVSGTASISTSNTNYGSFSIKDVNSSPVIKFTSGDGFVNKSIKITTHAATVACSGSTPIKNEIFTYTISGQYGTGTYTFSGCQHSSAGKAKVTATSGSASVTWTPSDGGWARTGNIQLGVSTTKITINNDSSSSGVLSINKGATAKMKVNLYGPSDATPKNTNFNASLSGTGTLSATSGTNGGTINVTGATNGARFNVTSGDGLVSSGQTIAVYTPSVSITASTPIRNQTFTYAVSGQYGSGTWTFTNCSHSSTGTAKVTADSGTATVKWTPADGGTAVSNSTTLGVTTTSIAINGSASASGGVYINQGAKASLKVNLYGPNNATPKNTNFTVSLSGSASGSAAGTLSATSGTNGGTITVTNPVNNVKVHITSGDGFATNYRTIIICTPTVSITASTPVRNQTFTYSLTGNTGSGTWTFTNCSHASAGTAKVTADSGTATVKWTPADGGTAVSNSTTLGVTPTSISFNSTTVNKGGTAYLQAYMYGPNSSTPKYNSITVTYSGSGTPSGWSNSSSVTTPATLMVTSINNTFTVTGKYSDSYGNTLSASGIISVKTPSASVTRNTSATLGNEFTYTVSNYSGTGTWSFTGTTTTFVSTGKRKMSGNGTVTAKWTPADGGIPVTAQYTYNTGTTTLSKTLVSDNATYYGNGIYWDKYSVSMTNANGRNITVSVSNGYVGTATSSTSTSITVASGTGIYIRRTGSQSANVTLSASAYTNASNTSYTFYSKPSNVTFSIT